MSTNPKRPTPPGFLDTNAASAALGVTRYTIRSYIRSGRLAATRVGVRFLIPQRSVDAVLAPTSAARGAK